MTKIDCNDTKINKQRDGTKTYKPNNIFDCNVPCETAQPNIPVATSNEANVDNVVTTIPVANIPKRDKMPPSSTNLYPNNN